VHSLSVSDLIVVEERVWDINKIEYLFPDDMVQAILDTALFAKVQNDRIAWMMECNGNYTIKSSYKLAMMELLHTDRFHVEGEWHRIWKVNFPRKAHIRYGGFAKSVLQHVSGYNHDMYNVR